MKKILYIILISLFSLTVISCANEEEEKVEAPVIAEVTPVTTPTFNSTPGYTFSSTKAGTITYGGSCSSWTTSATSGNNTILFKPLSYGTYSDCTMIVTDSDGNASNTLSVTSFTIYTQTKLMSGGYYNCALFGISSLKCWGENTYGQLGLGDNSTRGDGSGEMGDNLPVIDLGTGRTAKAVTMGHDHTCAILDNDSVKCWGRGRNGTLGYGNTNDLGDDSGEMGDNLPVVDLGTGRTAKAISSGQHHTCTILDNDSVKCWGHGKYTGYGSTNILGDDSGEMGDNLPVVDLGTGRTAKAITSGYYHNCAILDNDSLKCWGTSNNGQLGYGHNNRLGDESGEMGDNLPVVDLGTGRTAKAISSGLQHTCAILDNDALKCWGRNYSGRLGYGQKNTSNENYIGDHSGEMGDNLTVVDLGTGRTAKAVVSAGDHNCAILDDDSLKCWGSNSYGKLGYGHTNDLGDNSSEMGDNLTVVDLGTGRTAKAVTLGWRHSCAILDDDSLKCWGSGGDGQLGYGHTNDLGDNSSEMGDNLPVVDL